MDATLRRRLRLTALVAPAPLVALILAVLGSGAAATAAEAPADLLILNGRVYTLAWDEPATDGTPSQSAPRAGGSYQPDAQAVAIRGDRIVFVGAAKAAEAYRGPKTRVLDAKGAAVLPGLVDSHTHVVGLGEAASRVDLTNVKTEEEAVRLVA